MLPEKETAGADGVEPDTFVSIRGALVVQTAPPTQTPLTGSTAFPARGESTIVVIAAKANVRRRDTVLATADVQPIRFFVP